MTFDIGLHELCVRVGGRAGVRYIVTQFSRMDSLPSFVTHGAPLRSREMFRHFVFTAKATQPRPQDFSVNYPVFWQLSGRTFLTYRKLLLNSVNSSWL